MDTKICSKCKIDLPIDSFSFRSPGKRKGVCRKCVSAYHRQHYRQNKSKYLTKAKFHRNKDKERNRQIARKAKDCPCVDCGVQYPYYVMQFDHLPQYEKSFTIGTKLRNTFSVERLLAEINKCEVVCANCHHIRSHKRRNTKAGDRN